MRVLLINYEYPPVGGGASNATWEIARAMVKLGHEPVVLTARYKDRKPDLDNPKIKVIQVPALRRRKDRCSIFEMTTFVLSATWKIRKILQQEKIEGMIAFFSIPCGPIAWWGWRDNKIPYIISLRGGDVPGNEDRILAFHRFLRPFRRCVLRHSTQVVANSERLKIASTKADPVDVRVIPNGVDIDFWRPGENPRPAPPPFRFLCVGRLQEQKNHRWLFEQFSEFLKKWPTRKWELHLVGDGPLLAELTAFSKTSAIGDLLVWHGWMRRDQLLDLYQQSHCLVHPALYEGMSNVLMEAAACGLKIIVSRSVAQGLEIISDASIFQFNGPNSFQGLLAKIVQDAKISPHRIVKISSWDNTANSFIECYSTK